MREEQTFSASEENIERWYKYALSKRKGKQSQKK
jgi:hypothetical protein